MKPIDIVIAGVQKAATSSLQLYMGQHPQLLTHGEREFTFFIRDEEYSSGYENAFLNYFYDADLTKKILIKNVGIIFWEDVIQRLHQHNPHVKIILVLRNPVSRAYSAYWYARMKGYEQEESFESALRSGRQCPNDKINKGMIAYLDRGNYLFQLKTLYKYFSPEKVKIVLYEDLKDYPEKLLIELFSFCEIDNTFKPEIKRKFNESSRARIPWLAQLVNTEYPIRPVLRYIIPENAKHRIRIKLNSLNKKDFVPPPMSAVTKLRLIEYYKPMVQELSILLDRNLKQWNE